MTKAELNELVEKIIRIRDSYDFTRAERADLANACNIIYYNIDELAEGGVNMSREEAIKNIKRLWMMSDMTDEYGEMIDSEPFEESVNMAIQALSQEPICDRDCEHCTWTECPQEPCDDTVSIKKDVLKCRVGKLVVYNVEWLKKHWQMEMDIVCGVKPCDDVVSREAAITIAGTHTLTVDETVKALERLPSVTQKSGKWIPVSKRLPEDLEPVNITWVNHEPEPYYHDIKDKNFVATGIHYRGRWYWYSTTCADYLGEYGSNDIDKVDDAVEIVAWMPLPKPYEPQERSK